MTAEIAILNKHGVALAADSAVTAGRGTSPKIYNSVNKLFMLSKYHPVGVMVYGVAEFLGVPWETLIKVYRGRLGMKRFDTLREYADSFMAFLNGCNHLFPEAQQDRFFIEKVFAVFGALKAKIDRQAEDAIRKRGRVSDSQVRRYVSATLREARESLSNAELLSCFDGANPGQLRRKYEPRVLEIRDKVFGQLPISNRSERWLTEIAISSFIKKDAQLSRSGVVIAGFGAENCFPAVLDYAVDGMFEGVPRHGLLREAEISDTITASIMPFAQSEMVHTFMEGVDPLYDRVFRGYLDALFSELPKRIVGVLPGIGKRRRSDLVDRLEGLGKKLLEDFVKQTTLYRRKKHVAPVTNAVGVLPKDELAEMAESLVNLTSFKRRISMDAETVGGPIDVAVISKGDGFVWIRRKHYFKAELNPGFLANYYRMDDKRRGREDEQAQE